MVEELYIQDKIVALIEKYKEKIQRLVNPDNFQDWSDIGFDEKPEDFDSIEDFLEQDCTLDEEQQVSLTCYREFIEDLESLRVKDEFDIEEEKKAKKRKKSR